MNRITMLKRLVCFTVCVLSAGLAKAQEVDTLLHEADSLFSAGKLIEALAVHEKILTFNPACYEANVYIGCYYYLKGQEKLSEIDKAYKTIQTPNRMQLAHYQDQLKSVYQDFYSWADGYVKKALSVRKNDQMQQIISTIDAFRVRIGLAVPPSKKKRT